jgi:hypothetical protein
MYMYVHTYIHADQTCQMFQLANRFSTVSNTPNETSVFVTQCRSLSNIPFVNKSKISIFNVSNRGYWFVVVSFESMTRKQFFYHPQQQALHRHFQCNTLMNTAETEEHHFSTMLCVCWVCQVRWCRNACYCLASHRYPASNCR